MRGVLYRSIRGGAFDIAREREIVGEPPEMVVHTETMQQNERRA
jgi:hypothetical protein